MAMECSLILAYSGIWLLLKQMCMHVRVCSVCVAKMGNGEFAINQTYTNCSAHKHPLHPQKIQMLLNIDPNNSFSVIVLLTSKGGEVCSENWNLACFLFDL